MKLIRSTLFVTAAAIFAAACGDKVTVPPAVTTPAATPKVNSVSVSPATATMNVNDTITVTASVNADAGLATTVNWASSDANKASVTAGTAVNTAKIAAKAGSPGVAICATSTADAGKVGCISVVVSSAPSTTPASVAIVSITGPLGLNNPVPVPPAGVAGQIDVSVTVNPGTVKLDSVVAYVNNVAAGKQTYTAAQAAALRSEGDLAVAGQTSLPTLVFSINTAQFNATTGVVTWVNGTSAISAKAYGKQGTTAASTSASQSVTLLFANLDGVVVTATPSNATPQNSAAGFTYRSGALAVSVLPVIYTGKTLNALTAVWGSAACDNSAIGARTLALTAPVAPSTSWTGTLSNTAAAAGTNVTNYEFATAAPACAAQLAGGGESFAVTGVDGTSNAFAPVVTAPAIRLDNLAPAAPAVFANPNLRQANWLNDVVSLNTVQSATNLEGMIAAAVADGGVGTVTYASKAATGTTATTSQAAAVLAADITNTSTLAASLANTTYCLVQYSQDKLGNRSANPAAGACVAANTLLVGVDRAAPTIAFSGGLAASARRNGPTVGAEFQVTVSDTGVVGNSGMLSGSAVVGTVILRNATATNAGTCQVGAWATATGCSAISINAAPAYPLVPTTIVAANFLPGYYTFTGVARDAAGNASAAVTRTVVHDDAATPPAVTWATPFLPGSLSASAVSLSAVTSDNLDVRDFQYLFTYGATMSGLPIQTPVVAVNAFNATPLINTSYAANFSGSLMRQVQENPVAGAWAPTAATVLNSVIVNVRDQGGSVGTTLVTAVPGGTVNFTTAATNYAALAGTPSDWQVSNAATLVSDGAPVAPAVAANATSVTLNADLKGATAVFNSPFTRVDFYQTNAGTGTQWVLIGSVSSPVTTDNGAVRQHRYSLAWTPGTTYGLGGMLFRAVGVNAAGDGLSTTTNGSITVTNP